jgi:hypothetical protein
VGDFLELCPPLAGVHPYDGKDYPLKGSPIADTVSLERPDALTTLRTDKKDGKTFTVAINGVNAKGEPFNNMLVFERQ